MNGIARPLTASIKFKKKNQLNNYFKNKINNKKYFIKIEKKKKLNKEFKFKKIN